MNSFFQKIASVFKDRLLRKKIFIMLALLVVFRLLAAIPIPGIDIVRLEGFLAQSQLLGLINIFSGGGLSNLSIVMLGVGPYITGSIIMQLLTMMSPKLKAMYQEEGEAGRLKFAQYSRMITVPLAILQAFSFLVILEKQGILTDLTLFGRLVNVIVITGGSVLLMWLGELMTEFGIGNGLSMIIFAGIVAQIPTTISQFVVKYIYPTFDPSVLPVVIAFLVVALVIVFGVVLVTEAERPIPITYAKRVRGNKVYGGVSTYLPLRVNQAGVIPIIFALSLLLFPQLIFKFVSTNVANPTIQGIASFANRLLENGWFYSITYFILVFLFTYFYTAVTFDPDLISTNLQKSGAFIPGVRPGQSTSEYLTKVLTRITLVGATFLGFIAVLPFIMRGFTQDQSLAIGGTALLIVVSVILDLVKKVEAQLSMREY